MKVVEGNIARGWGVQERGRQESFLTTLHQLRTGDRCGTVSIQSPKAGSYHGEEKMA